MPKPLRNTVVGVNWNAAPIRGWMLFLSVSNAARPTPLIPVKPMPPYTLYPGNWV